MNGLRWPVALTLLKRILLSSSAQSFETTFPPGKSHSPILFYTLDRHLMRLRQYKGKKKRSSSMAVVHFHFATFPTLFSASWKVKCSTKIAEIDRPWLSKCVQTISKYLLSVIIFLLRFADISVLPGPSYISRKKAGLERRSWSCFDVALANWLINSMWCCCSVLLFFSVSCKVYWNFLLIFHISLPIPALHLVCYEGPLGKKCRY